MGTVLVTGATGNLGSKVVRNLLGLGHAVRVYTRGGRSAIPAEVETIDGDIRTGTGLSEATRGVAAIVHCATFFDPDGATDLEGTRHLIRSASQNGSPHLVYISIVGIEQIAFPYFKTKLEVEKLIESSELPYSIVRSTQFHDFVLKFIAPFEDERTETIGLPTGVEFQSIDVNEVAKVLAELTTNAPVGRAPDVGGPEVLTLEAMARAYARAFGKPRTVRSEPMAKDSEFHDAFRRGVNIVSGRRVGRTTWETFLRQRAAAASRVTR